MKKITTLICAALIASFGAASAHEYMGGADVGNGGFEGTSYDHIHDVYDYLDAVSSEVTRGVLFAAKMKAQGNLSGARNYIVQSYRKALQAGQSYRRPNAPLTIDALELGITMNRAFKGACGGSKDCQDFEDTAALMFLSSYSQHIVDEMIPLDDSYYMPYYSSCERRSRAWWKSFATQYKESAVSLLRLVAGESTNIGLPAGMGLDEYEIKVGIQVLKNVVKNLRRDPFRRLYRFEMREALDMLDYIKDMVDTGMINDPYEQKALVSDLRYTNSNLLNGLDRYVVSVRDDWDVSSPICRK